MSPTRAEIEARLEQIDQKKAATLKALKERRQKLKAKLAALDRPSKAERRLDARRKILLGAFVLEQLEQAGQSPQAFTLEGERFFDWLVRPNDRAVFDLPSPAPAATSAGAAPHETPLDVPYADKDQAKALGARWHADQKRWVVPAGRDLTPFRAWLPPESTGG